MIDWYSFEYQVSQELDQALDMYSRQNNLIEMFRMFKRKIEEVEANANAMNSTLKCDNAVLTTKIQFIEEENTLLKKIIKKMALKDYPELVFENPHFFTDENIVK